MRRQILSLVGLLALLCACRGTPPANPDAAAVEWLTHTDAALGYALEYPDVYRIERDPDGSGLRFRYDGYPCISITHIDVEESRRRGLWAKHDPAGSIELGGKPGSKYVYNHYDGPFSMRTISYVVEHEGKFFGLEFRTNREELDGVQQRILGSLRFESLSTGL